jgi:cell division protein FtsB
VADAATDDGDGDDGPALLPVAGGDVPAAGAAAAATTRRGPGSRASRRASAGRGSRGPSPAHPGEPRRQRVLQALAALDRGRGPVDDEAAERWAARRQRIGSGLTAAAVGLLVVLVIYVVFPVRAALDQRAAAERARERLEVFERENALLEAEARELRDDDYIEELAREMGLVLPGEESYGILPAPREPAAPDDGSTSTTRPGG